MHTDKEFPKKEMDRIAGDFPGRIGVYIEDLSTGTTHQHDADRRFPTASICKVPVMIELFRQTEEGHLSLDERRRLMGDISTHGTGMLKLIQDEPELTLRDYCRLMISVSDNMATDLLIETVGLDAINATMDELGFGDTRVTMTLGRWHYMMVGLADEPCNRANDQVYLDRARTKGPDPESLSFQDSRDNNVTTAREMGIILSQLHKGQIVSPCASAAMIDMLKGCQDRRMIPRDLSPEISVAHKIGSSGRIKGDVGIAYLPTGPLVISALALADEPTGRGDEAIAQISRLPVKALSPESIVA